MFRSSKSQAKFGYGCDLNFGLVRAPFKKGLIHLEEMCSQPTLTMLSLKAVSGK